ncbi:MAG: hypothetical protein ACKVHP_22265, partial [Verrucomicrobiales bacterium]
MRRILPLFIILTSLIEGQEVPVVEEPSAQPGFPPRKFDASRYEAIWAKNPFIAEVVPEETAVEETEKWAEGLILRGVTRIEGKYVVHVEDNALAKEKDPTKQRARYQRLVEDASGASIGGLRIVHVKAHRDPNQVEVTVSKGEGADAREAVVMYDPKELAVKAPVVKPPKPGSGVRRPTTTRRTVTPQTTRRQAPAMTQQ